MVQDYTKIGIQPEQPDQPDPLTAQVRDGTSEQPGLGLAIKKLTGAVPLGIDAPTKGMRKGISGAWELLGVLKYGMGAVFFLLLGCAFLYSGLAGGFAPELVAFGVGSLVLSAMLARLTLQAAKNLRAIARA